MATEGDKCLIDCIIDNGPPKAGTVNYNDLHNLYGYEDFFCTFQTKLNIN